MEELEGGLHCYFLEGSEERRKITVVLRAASASRESFVTQIKRS